MTVLIFTAATLLAAFLFHLGLWRVRVPVHQLKALLVIFGFFFAAASLVLLLSPDFSSFILHPSSLASGAWLGWLYFALFYWAAAFCYVITYSAMEGDSPTLSLTRALDRAGAHGLSREEIEEFFRQRPFIGARLTALVKDGVLMPEPDGYRLAPGNYWFFRLILGYRRVMFGKIKDGG
jgi:hypothetical protein